MSPTPHAMFCSRMFRSRMVCLALGAVAFSGAAHADSAVASFPSFPPHLEPLIAAMDAELSRSMTELNRPGREVPYFGAYWLVETDHRRVEAALGSVVVQDQGRQRFLRVEMRVGSPTLDNSNYFFPVSLPFGVAGQTLVSAPLDDDPAALRRIFWLASDAAYRSATEVIEHKKAEQQSSVAQPDQPPDFGFAPKDNTFAVQSGDLPPLAELEALARKASLEFKAYPQIYHSSVTAEAWTLARSFISNEGVRGYQRDLVVRFSIVASTQADDGMPIERTRYEFALPTAEQLKQSVLALAEEVVQLRQAPVVEDYSGAMLFEGEAGAQIVCELMARAVSGTSNAQGGESLWTRRLGKRVLPKGIDAFDDPSLDSWRGLPLIGGYAMDDEGVPGRRVALVEDGNLQGLLMARTPNEQLRESNGHARSGLVGWAQAGLGNLIVEARKGQDRAALRRRLLQTVKEQKGTYGLVVQALEPRDFTTGGSVPPQPQRMLKLYLDGREELVRGAELQSMTPRDLRDILAATRDVFVYSYIRQTGGVPVPGSVVAPSLLFEDVEVRKPAQAHQLPPALARPALN